MAERPEPIEFRPQVRIKCPFCDGVATAGEEDGVPTILHTLPPCPSFVELEPDEYLRAVRLRLSE